MKGLLLALASLAPAVDGTAGPLIYEGAEGPLKGRHVVLIASDHEYKSEESLSR